MCLTACHSIPSMGVALNHGRKISSSRRIIEWNYQLILNSYSCHNERWDFNPLMIFLHSTPKCRKRFIRWCYIPPWVEGDEKFFRAIFPSFLTGVRRGPLNFQGTEPARGTPLACTMERNRTQRHAERMHGPGIIWLAPLEACVFIRRRLGAAQFHWITSGNQPSWPELSAKCIPLPRANPRNPGPERLSLSLSLSFCLSLFLCTYFKLPASIALQSRPSRSDRLFCIRQPWMHEARRLWIQSMQ